MQRKSFTTKQGKVKCLHIEANGCIINVRVGLSNINGKSITAIEIIPDKHVGEEWDFARAYGGKELDSMTVRVIRRKSE